jgi:ribA/ribD-fused uncharacterized protein
MAERLGKEKSMHVSDKPIKEKKPKRKTSKNSKLDSLFDQIDGNIFDDATDVTNTGGDNVGEADGNNVAHPGDDIGPGGNAIAQPGNDVSNPRGGHVAHAGDKVANPQNFTDMQLADPKDYSNQTESNVQTEILATVRRIETNMTCLEKRLSAIESQIQHIQNDAHTAKIDAAQAKQNVIEVSGKIETVNKNLDQTNSNLKAQNSKYDELHRNYKSLLEKHLSLDSYNRRENLIFHGLGKTPNENCSMVVRDCMKNDLKIPVASVDAMRFQRCHRLSEKGNAPIICRFALFGDRDYVWKQRFSLQGTGKFITEQFAPEIEDRRRGLYPVLKAAKSKKMKVSMKYDKLVIDGITYSWDNLQSLPQELNPAKIATQSRNGITCFFTGASPLSNFYKIDLTIDGEKFDSVERILQWSKALFAQQPLKAAQIRKAKGPAECKSIGDSINVKEEAWLAQAKQIVYRACRLKFSQNELCKQFLLNTGNDALAEAGPNKVWGIGLKMSSPDAYDKNKWQGQNILGEILTAVRKNLTEN